MIKGTIMSRIIYCIFLKKKTEGQDFQSYPGELGKYIFNNISKEAWLQYQSKQTMLINEKKLSTLNINDRKLIEKYMINFFFKDRGIDIKKYINN